MNVWIPPFNRRFKEWARPHLNLMEMRSLTSKSIWWRRGGRGLLLDQDQKLQFARGCRTKVCATAHRNVTNKKQKERDREEEREGGVVSFNKKKRKTKKTKLWHHQHVVCGVTNPPSPTTTATRAHTHTHNSIGAFSPDKSGTHPFVQPCAGIRRWKRLFWWLHLSYFPQRL